MRAKHSIISLALVALNCLSGAHAQTQESGTLDARTVDAAASKAEAEARRELELKAFALLDETVSAARGLKLAENRARVLATAAGLLWPRDEKAARALFKEATDVVTALVVSAPEDRQSSDSAQVVMQLRQELIEIAARRDAQLALDFLRATRPPSQDLNQAGGSKHSDQELMLEMNLATQIAAQEPKRALRMAEESLSKGFTQGLLGVLHLLSAKDPEAATHLAGLIIKKLSAEDLLDNYEATNVAAQLLNIARPTAPSTSDSLEELKLAPRGGIKIDERLRRQLIETLVAAAVSDRASRTGYTLHNVLQQVMPEVEKYAPSRLAALRRKSADFERQLDPHSRMLKEYRTVLEQGPLESLVEAASKAPAEVRDQLYMQAYWRAVGEGEGDRARQLIEKISNPQQRAQMLLELDRQLPWRAFERGNYEEARQLVARLPVEERAPLLLQIAGSLLSKGDKQGARQLLEESAAIFGPRAMNQQQFNSRLESARLYASFDRVRAFELIEASAGQLDELIAAAAVLDGFYQEFFREGELKQQGGYIWNDLIGRCAAAMAQLAPADFTRASSVAERFQRTDVRVTLQLMFVRDLIASVSQEKEGAPQNLTPTRRTFTTRVLRQH